MRQIHDRLWRTLAYRHAPVECRQVSILRMRRRPSRLTHRAFDVAIGFARLPTHSLSRAFPVPRTQTSPTGLMLGDGERAQIHADFANDGPGRFAVDSRYCH